MNREPAFDIDLERGRQAELFAADIRDGFTRNTVEVKNDEQFRRTGNIYVELECRYPRRGWQSSPHGPTSSNAADMFMYQLKPGVAVVFTRDKLVSILSNPRLASVGECRRGTHPTRGRLINLARLFTPTRRRDL